MKANRIIVPNPIVSDYCTKIKSIFLTEKYFFNDPPKIEEICYPDDFECIDTKKKNDTQL